jgi:hypothetical protein
MKPKKPKKISIGWQECCELPDLGIKKIHAKVDTGARTSALHAVNIELIMKDDKPYIRFAVYPHQYDDELLTSCEAEVLDQRYVMNSGGQKELRYVIKTHLLIGKKTWPIELTLTNREPMNFRMLLGREALKRRVLINTGRRYLQGHRDEIEVASKPSGE